MGNYVKRDPRNLKKWIIDTTITFPSGETAHLKRSGYDSKSEADADFYRVKNDFMQKRGFKTKGTFEEIKKKYIEYKSTKIKFSSLTVVSSICERYLDFGKYSLKDIYQARFLEGFRSNIIDLNKSQGTINRIIHIMAEISEFAFNRELISLDMYRRSKVYLEPISGQAKPRIQYKIWTHDQYDRFISTFNDDDKYRPLFRWMFFSGARIGETCALQWKDFDEKQRTIHIYKTASARLGVGKSLISTTKTKAGDRYILLNEDMLNDFLILKTAFGEKSESFLFFGNNEPIGYTTIRRVFNNHIDLARLPRIKIHEIRHTNNTWLLDENPSRAAADIVTKRLGRSSLKVTLDTYYHSNPAVEESIVKKIKI